MSAIIIYLEKLSKEDIATISDNLNSKEIAVLLYLWSLVFLGNDNVWIVQVMSSLNLSFKESHELLISMQEKGIKINIKYINF
jgi:hypothetical protein